MKRFFQIFVSALVSFAFIYILYSHIHWHECIEILRASNWRIMGFALSLIIPITVLLGVRFWLLVPYDGHISLFQSVRLTFIASSFNLVLPAKMGDVAKILFIRRSAKISGAFLLSLVTLEKALDFFGVLLFASLGLFWISSAAWWVRALQIMCAVGVAMTLTLFVRKSVAKSVMRSFVWMSPKKIRPYLLEMWKVWVVTHRYFAGRPDLIFKTFAISIVESGLTFAQIWLFIPALNAHAPFLPSLSLIAIATLGTIISFTVAGIGPRDALIVLLFLPYFSAEMGVALGLMVTARLVVPALIGAPMIFTEMWLNRRSKLVD